MIKYFNSHFSNFFFIRINWYFTFYYFILFIPRHDETLDHGHEPADRIHHHYRTINLSHNLFSKKRGKKKVLDHDYTSLKKMHRIYDWTINIC